MADKKSKSKLRAADFGADGAEPQPSLGHIITESRERKGMTREQVAGETHLPAHYIKMIETDSYDMISDRLYLVPFLRRYATFLGLDAEEIASRFVSDVQHAEANVVRISQEITMVAKRPAAASRIAFAVLIAAVLVLLADFAWRRFVDHEAPTPAPAASPAAMAPAAESNTQAPNETLPPATIVTNPEGAAPPSSPPAASNAPRSASVPPAANRPAPSRPLPRAATDE
ncbi:helix-turn-helix domain-containing protein [Candidatus Binatus sp.]|uniref:helix-turn-helix domain-containing protein n=1 Tax=Candidatus Binatus sp. TaxID=2811406 RepID=UPI003BE471B2